MGKKHKKHKVDHKERRHDMRSPDGSMGSGPGSEVRTQPLKLVLKVGDRHQTTTGLPSDETARMVGVEESGIASQGGDSMPPILPPMASGGESSSTWMKKKKKKKKHRHHHDHHHRHHHHHHSRHCSHHSSRDRSEKRERHDEPSTHVPSKDIASIPSSSSSVTHTPLITPPPSRPKTPPPPPTLPAPPILTPLPQPQGSGTDSLSTSSSSLKTQMQHMLNHLLKQLQRKDAQEFFYYPVTDLIAPGYSLVIKNPMDFSKMKAKIEKNQYRTLSEFKSDVKLIADNCMTYNRPETIYYKAAKKLWHFAKDKLFSKDAVSELGKLFPGLGPYELGISAPDADMRPMQEGLQYLEEIPVDEKADFVQLEDGDEEEGPTPEQILEDARRAAQEAADRLTFERPKGTHLSMLRQRKDGSTTLAIAGSGYEKPILLEQLVGKISEGAPFLPPYIDPDANQLKAMQSLDSLPFASYLPSLTSKCSNLNEEQTRLLLSVYGDDELGLDYAKSLQNFASESDHVIQIVDSLLDILTQGQHSKVAVKLRNESEAEEVLKSETRQQEESEKPSTSAVSPSATSTTTNGTEEAAPTETQVDTQLDETGALLKELNKIQTHRLSVCTVPIPPSEMEKNMAEKVTEKLTNFISTNAAPGDVVSDQAIHDALGIKIE